MTTLARVVVLPMEPGPLRIEEVNLPDPGPHQVVIKQLASGICHTQLHQLQALLGALFVTPRAGDSLFRSCHE